ncbi:hypothetical protein NDU88_010837 [Pleurodeles waltl]|uniref:Uncharacterized protein n=1 Tax=Pleurodeles waltl TaxID=8319 RepID=A0AAV7QVI7_PLEWA|nr:hypothetical protein NDU88_010837 [Pleurodeles waltl]
MRLPEDAAGRGSSRRQDAGGREPQHPTPNSRNRMPAPWRQGKKERRKGTGGGASEAPIAAYRIQQRTESDRFPQLIKIRNEWNRLPTDNFIISAPVSYDTKTLKWKGPGLDKVMEEVYCSAGTTKELKETLRTQEQEDHTQGERVTA